jgi:hypothetical protein
MVSIRTTRRGMRYLVKARVRPGKESALLEAIRTGTLGRGSIAGDEYVHNMRQARLAADGTAEWVEVCFCPTPLAEERPYWEEFFQIERVTDAHNRRNCRHENGTERWACSNCDCTRKLEAKLGNEGEAFLRGLEAGSFAKDARSQDRHADQSEHNQEGKDGQNFPFEPGKR